MLKFIGEMTNCPAGLILILNKKNKYKLLPEPPVKRFVNIKYQINIMITEYINTSEYIRSKTNNTSIWAVKF